MCLDCSRYRTRFNARVPDFFLAQERRKMNRVLRKGGPGDASFGIRSIVIVKNSVSRGGV